ncbi:HD domain-containing phosphohydrolase [Reinekea marinisedimentorum]|uniref:Putative two-component system response regulator n=1 Tax=Reinekea marinisedimentorum TaxID=230495 RepID=A0A4R3I4Y5_9GAMM|nr:HD domain-containing phosphohydrolase [Reinekea marinisedimentorum]TCS40691.1 putative two-component system response regulator [Reinekea marinisedimentorum]
MSEEKEKLLIVDDEVFYIDILVDLLAKKYTVSVAKNGQQALDRIENGYCPDLVLLDVLMPDMNGYEVCQLLKMHESTQDTPVIFLTVKSDVESEINGFEIGAADYISKPFSMPIVKARVETHLALARTRKRLEYEKSLLEVKIRERTQEISRTQDIAMYCMSTVVEARDNETGAHIRRTQHYIKALADRLRKHPEFAETLTPDYIDMLYKSAPLHDIGKVAVPDAILLKPGKLTPKEWEEMKKHTTYGLQALERTEVVYGSSSFLKIAKEIVYSHHERWDGTGYPEGLFGKKIPLSARLMALADCYDALISRRAYKEPFSHEEARRIVIEGRGTHFDPYIVDAFIQLESAFVSIANQFVDE